MIISTICKLLLAMGVGYYLNKKRVFTEEVSQKAFLFRRQYRHAFDDRDVSQQHRDC